MLSFHFLHDCEYRVFPLLKRSLVKRGFVCSWWGLLFSCLSNFKFMFQLLQFQNVHSIRFCSIPLEYMKLSKPDCKARGVVKLKLFCAWTFKVVQFKLVVGHTYYSSVQRNTDAMYKLRAADTTLGTNHFPKQRLASQDTRHHWQMATLNVLNVPNSKRQLTKNAVRCLEWINTHHSMSLPEYMCREGTATIQWAASMCVGVHRNTIR